MNYQRSSAVQAAKALVLHARRRRQLAACNTLAAAKAAKKEPFQAHRWISGTEAARVAHSVQFLRLVAIFCAI